MPVELTWIRQSIMLEVGVACKLLGLHVLNVAAHQATVCAGGPCDARGELVCLIQNCYMTPPVCNVISHHSINSYFQILYQ